MAQDESCARIWFRRKSANKWARTRAHRVETRSTRCSDDSNASSQCRWCSEQSRSRQPQRQDESRRINSRRVDARDLVTVAPSRVSIAVSSNLVELAHRTLSRFAGSWSFACVQVHVCSRVLGRSNRLSCRDGQIFEKTTSLESTSCASGQRIERILDGTIIRNNRWSGIKYKHTIDCWAIWLGWIKQGDCWNRRCGRSSRSGANHHSFLVDTRQQVSIDCHLDIRRRCSAASPGVEAFASKHWNRFGRQVDDEQMHWNHYGNYRDPWCRIKMN